MKRLAFSTALALASVSWIALDAQAAEPRVGVTSAVNPQATGVQPGAAARQLVIGGDIIFRERVITTDEGQAQLLFLDQSSLMIGPNSQVVIDEFVYDPNTSKGNIVATLTQGSFRYIGGKLSKQGNATLKTPVATIGIRGTDVTVTHEAPKTETKVITTNGTADIQTPGGFVKLRTGFGSTINSLTLPPGPALALTAAQIAAINGMFEGRPGKNAGAKDVPTDGDVADSGLSSTVEAKGLSLLEPAAGGEVLRSAQNVLPTILPPDPFVGRDPNVVSPPGNSGNPPPGNPPPGNNPPPVGPRTEQVLNGYVAGFGNRTNEQTSYSDILTNDDPTSVEIRTIPDADGPGRVLATFSFRGVDSENLSSASVIMGDAAGSGPALKSVFVDDNNFYALQSSTENEGKGKIRGYDAAANAIMVSIPASGELGEEITGFPTGALCQCEFVKWGLWVAVLESSSAEDMLIVPTGLWVAGKLPSATDPSPNGTATFTGTAVGMVQDSQSNRFATGAFSNAYNFAQKTGTVTVSNFDGNKSFGGNVSAGSDWRHYSGALSGSGLNGGVKGSFYGNRTPSGQLQTPRETGGSFHVTGGNYAASGIFIGKNGAPVGGAKARR